MFKLRRLEDRIVLDGAGMMDALDEAHAQDVHEEMLHDYAQNDVHQNEENAIDSTYLADGTGQEGDGIHVLVISSGIEDADDLAAAAKDGVLVVRYDASDTTLEDLSQIIANALDGQTADSIAFATHNSDNGQLNLTQSDAVSLESLGTDAQQQAFWNTIGGMIADDGRIDLMGCGVAQDEAGEAFVAEIESLSGVNVAASSDDTGNEADGGDWILESDNVDVQEIYFDADELGEFDGVIANEIPIMLKNKPLSSSNSATDEINDTHLFAYDAEDSIGSLTYTITGLGSTDNVFNGNLFRDADGDGVMDAGEQLTSGSTFAQRDLYMGFIKYTHDGSDGEEENFTFKVTDSEGASTVNYTFTIAVNQPPPVEPNSEPYIAANTGLSVYEKSSDTQELSYYGVIDGSALMVKDVESSADQLTYTLTGLTKYGSLWFDANSNGVIDGDETELTAGSTFTQADINGATLTYAHDGVYEGPLQDRFNFNLVDSGNSNGEVVESLNGIFTITVEEVNDAPGESVNNTIMVDNETAIIDGSYLRFTDADDSSTNLTYTLQSEPSSGGLYIQQTDGIQWLAVGSTFTQADINLGNIRYERADNASSEDVSDSFEFTVNDNGGPNDGDPVLFAETEDGSTTFTFDITVEDLNESPVLLRNDAILVNEGDSGTIDSTYLKTTDPDATDTPENLTYTITDMGTALANGNTDPFGGTLYLDANGNGILDDGEALSDEDGENTFTQADVDNGLLRYEHDEELIDVIEEPYRDEFRFTVTDSGGRPDENGSDTPLTITSEEPFVINITNMPDPPEVTTTEADVTENESVNITSGNLTATDPDYWDIPANLTYTLTETLPTDGDLFIDENGNGVRDEEDDPATPDVDESEAVLGAGGTFTQEDINSGKLYYQHNGAENATDTFSFIVVDSDEQQSADTTFTINVTNVNDLPVVTTSDLILTNVNDQNYGTINNSLLAATDPDEEDTADNLTYQVTNPPDMGDLFLDNNGNGVRDTGDILLNTGTAFTQENIDSGLVTYVYTNGSRPLNDIMDTFTFKVSDGNSGILTNQTFDIVVEGTNDVPNEVTNTPLEVLEGGPGYIQQTNLSYVDPDDTNANLTYTLNTIPESGVLSLSGVDLQVGDTFTQEDINNNSLEYDHTGEDIGGEYTFDFTVTDADGGKVTSTFVINVEEDNDAPTLQTFNTPLSMPENELRQITSSMLQYSDPDNTSDQLTYTLTSLPEEGYLFVDDTENPNGVYDSDTDVKLGVETGILTFTQQDINEGRLYYQNQGEGLNDYFKLTITDAGGASATAPTFFITITSSANDTPEVDINTGLSTPEGETAASITAAILHSTDYDVNEDAGDVTYTMMSSPDVGFLFIDDAENPDGTAGEFDDGIDTKLSTNSTFTQLQIDNGNVYYKYDGEKNSEDATYSFDFTVKDSYGATSPSDTFDITVTNANDAPVENINTGANVEEGGTTTVYITNTMLEFTDPDNDHTADLLTYTLTALPETGNLYLGTTELSVDITFTQEQINQGLFSYIYVDKPDQSDMEDNTDTFKFTVSDNGLTGDTEVQTSEEATFTINIENTNEVPVVATNEGITVVESQQVVIGQDELETIDYDDDDAAEQLTYTLTDAPDYGTLELEKGGVLTVLTVGNTFTQADINANVLYYEHDGTDLITSDSFNFTVKDDGSPALTTEATTFDITITDVNDSPVVENNTSAHTDEGGTIVITSYNLSISDGDDLDENLTYTLESVPVHGTLWFDVNGNGALDSGEEALAVGDTFTQAKMNEDILTYQHDGDESPSETFSFTATDDDDGKLTETTFNISVGAQNDAPALDPSANKGITVCEGDTGFIGDANLMVTDAEDASNELIYEITGLGEAEAGENGILNTFNGTLFIDENLNGVRDAGEDIGITSTFSQYDISTGMLAYEHDGSDDIQEVFQFKVTDTLGAALTDEFTINIYGINDAPVFTSETPDIVENVPRDVETLISGVGISDPDSYSGNMSIIIRAEVSEGTISVSEYSGADIQPGSDIETGIIIIEGTQDAINGALATLTFTPTESFTGDTSNIVLEVVDNGHTGEGDSESATHVIEIGITDTGTDVPPYASNSTITAYEDIEYTFSVDDFNISNNTTAIVVVGSDNGKLIWNDTVIEEGVEQIIPLDENGEIDGTLTFVTTYANENYLEYAEFQYRVYNEDVPSDTGYTMTVNVTPVNDAPVNTVPGVQTVEFGETLTFNGKIRITDVDFNSNIQQYYDPEAEVEVQVGVLNGTLTVDGGFASVEGNGTTTLVLRGTVNEINAELYGMEYDGSTLGADTLTITTSDQGNFGSISQMPGVDTDEMTINVIANADDGVGILVDQTMSVNNKFVYQFTEFSDNEDAAYTIEGLPTWLTFNAASRTFWYVPNFSTPAEPNYTELGEQIPYTITITATYSSGTVVEDTFELDVFASLDRELLDTLELLDQHSPDTVPADTEGMEMHEFMMAHSEEAALVAAENMENIELFETLALLDSNPVETSDVAPEKLTRKSEQTA